MSTVSSKRESFSEQFSRLRQMSEDASGETWDLSENDLAALAAVLKSHALLRQALQWVLTNVTLDDTQRAFVTKAFEESKH